MLNVLPDTSTLSAGVAAAILAAALLHASWNALIKGAGDKGMYTLLLHACSGAIGLIGLMFTGLPSADIGLMPGSRRFCTPSTLPV